MLTQLEGNLTIMMFNFEHNKPTIRIDQYVLEVPDG